MADFLDFCKTIQSLRHPQTGCPWDLEQTHKTLRRYMLEEAYEAADVMDPVDDQKLCGELGDVLLQVVLNAQLAADRGAFTIADVVQGINEKMIRRHPHVFGDAQQRSQRSLSQIYQKWDETKQQEESTSKKSSPAADKNPFAGLDPSKERPAFFMATEIGKISHRVGFDWTTVAEVFSQVERELEELRLELEKKPQEISLVEEELGDVLFSLVQLCRHLNLDAETVLFSANKKFLHRFQKMVTLADGKGWGAISSLKREQMEQLWIEAKNASSRLKECKA